jgi:SP family sugar:H+ symporter-like MFS transporter
MKRFVTLTLARRTISGIMAMKWWLKQFSTGYKDKDGNPAITPNQSSEIVSILSAGTFFGALLAAPLADRIGRRKSLMVAVAVFSFGVASQTASMAIPLFTAGRYAVFE